MLVKVKMKNITKPLKGNDFLNLNHLAATTEHSS
jgi:hypothetical protein